LPPLVSSGTRPTIAEELWEFSTTKADFSDVTSGASTSSPTPATTGGQSYTVKSGDSLSKIAKHFYGDANQWHRIYDANKDKIKNPDLIHPGQEFTIPAS
jgi:nucleoid-associated protein YgaU